MIGLIIGFASQRTLGNFSAGLLIAFTQPLRLGDRIAVDDVEGGVEEIGLTHTFIRADDDTGSSYRTSGWPPIPSETPRSSTVRNAPRSRCRFH